MCVSKALDYAVNNFFVICANDGYDLNFFLKALYCKYNLNIKYSYYNVHL